MMIAEDAYGIITSTKIPVISYGYKEIDEKTGQPLSDILKTSYNIMNIDDNIPITASIELISDYLYTKTSADVLKNLKNVDMNYPKEVIDASKTIMNYLNNKANGTTSTTTK